jgi:hypothetical protein
MDPGVTKIAHPFMGGYDRISILRSPIGDGRKPLTLGNRKTGVIMTKIIMVTWLLLSYLLFWSCSKQKTVEPYGPDTPEANYIGSETCGYSTCHLSTYEMFIETGHAHIVSPISGNQGPLYPFDSLRPDGGISQVGPPEGNNWNDYLYVIGGYGWKTLFVKTDGKIETAGAAQYNFEDQTWVVYQENQEQPYDYTCFKCHTTGPDSSGEWQPAVQGSFSLPGVQCEACHGKGSLHAKNPKNYLMHIDRTAELCSSCHMRDPQNSIAVRDEFIRNYQQYNELKHSPHNLISCSICHDPHASAHFDNIARGDGVRECTSCHNPSYESGQANNKHLQAPSGRPTCRDCHMPLAARSATNKNKYQADVHSHIFKINTEAADKDSLMWTPAGDYVSFDQSEEAALTLDFACYGCHKDMQWVGGFNSRKTLQELSDKAKNIHKDEE